MTANKSFFLCYFETTRKCNLNCRYCMNRKEGVVHLPGRELSTAEIKELVIDRIKEYSPSGGVAFSGGEHLLRPDALEIIEYNARAGLWTFLNTNASLLDGKLVAELKKITNGRIIFGFPVNSTDNKKNKWSRDDDLSTVVKAVKNCQKYKLPFFILVTISRQNLEDLADTMKFLKKNGIPVLRAPFVPRGSGKQFNDLMFDKKDMEDKIFPVLNENFQCYVSFTPFFASPEFVRSGIDENKFALNQLGCQAAKGFIGISPEGDVYPCVQLIDSDLKCGNVLNENLLDILRKNELLREMRERKNYQGNCGKCRYKMTCGGCRAVSYYKTGDPLASDPTCFFEPADENARSPFEEVQNKNTEKFFKYIRANSSWQNLF